MLIYGVSWTFAHNRENHKTISSTDDWTGLGEGVDVPGRCAAILGQFFRATIFLRLFFQFTDAFLGRFYRYLHIFVAYYVYFNKKSNSVLATKFSWYAIDP